MLHFSKSSHFKKNLNLKTIRKLAQGMKRHFTKENGWVTNKHRKRCSISLAIREMHIKITMRYQRIPIRMVKIKKIVKKTLRKIQKNRLSHTLLEGTWSSTVTLEVNLALSFKTKNGFIVPSSNCIALLDIYPAEVKTNFHTETSIRMLIVTWFVTAKTGNHSNIFQRVTG